MEQQELKWQLQVLEQSIHQNQVYLQQQQDYTGTSGNGATSSSSTGTSVTITAKSKGVLGGQDRQVVLIATGVQSGVTTTTTISLVRN